MGVTVSPSTLDGGVTPICNDCGICLCWDISLDDYEECKGFWDNWICESCNDGVPLSLKGWKRENG